MSEETAPAPAGPELPDRSTAIKVVGGIQIALGALAALSVPMSLLGLLAQGMTGATLPPRLQLTGFLAGLVLYGGVAFILVWSGVGLLRLQRWAGAVALTFSAMWLVVGIAAIVKISLMFPTMMRALDEQMRSSGRPVPPEALAVMKTIGLIFGLGFSALVYVLIPGGLTAFLSRPSVQGTLQARSPGPAWTDACPPPVLGMAGFFAFGAALSLMALPVAVLPAAGTIVAGWPAVLYVLAVAAVLAGLAYGFYRLRPLAWWVAVAWMLLSGCSTVYTFTRVDMVALYEKMGVSGEMLKLMSRMAPAMGMVAWSSAAVAVALLGYLVFLRRYFRPANRFTKAA